jgi:hypothetical protein
MTANRFCSVEGCERQHTAKGYCKLHYYRLRNTGLLMSRRDKPLYRFWQFVKIDPNGCWLWTGGKIKGGYGHFKFRGGTRKAHVWLWEQFNGPVPDVFGSA